MQEVRLLAHRLADHLHGRDQPAQRGQEAPELQPGQRPADAVVRAGPEADVRVRPPVDAELVGRREHFLVAIARGQPDHHLITLPDLGRADGGVGGGRAHGLHRWRGPAQDLVHRGADQAGIIAQPLPGVRALGEREDGPGDSVRGGLQPTVEQPVTVQDDLLIGQLAPVHLRLHQRRHHVRAGPGAALVHQIHEVGEDRGVRGGLGGRTAVIGGVEAGRGQSHQLVPVRLRHTHHLEQHPHRDPDREILDHVELGAPGQDPAQQPSHGAVQFRMQRAH